MRDSGLISPYDGDFGLWTERPRAGDTDDMTQNTSESAPVEDRDIAGPAARNRRITAGGILIVVGLGLLGLQVVEGVGDSIWLFLIGTLFIAGYLFRNAYGLLVAGSIITGIALGQVGEEAFGSVNDITTLGLGIGFVAIYVVDRLYTGSSHWWPLIPGGILLVTGLGSLGEPFSRALELAWPLLMIVVGLALLFGLTGKRNRSRDRHAVERDRS